MCGAMVNQDNFLSLLGGLTGLDSTRHCMPPLVSHVCLSILNLHTLGAAIG